MSNVENLNPQEAVSVLGKLEETFREIIREEVAKEIQSLGLLTKEKLSEEIQYHLENEDLVEYGRVYDIVQDECSDLIREIADEQIDGIEFADKFDIPNAVEDAMGGDYVKRDELDSALDELSISRG